MSSCRQRLLCKYLRWVWYRSEDLRVSRRGTDETTQRLIREFRRSSNDHSDEWTPEGWDFFLSHWRQRHLTLQEHVPSLHRCSIWFYASEILRLWCELRWGSLYQDGRLIFIAKVPNIGRPHRTATETASGHAWCALGRHHVLVLGDRWYQKPTPQADFLKWHSFISSSNSRTPTHWLFARLWAVAVPQSSTLCSALRKCAGWSWADTPPIRSWTLWAFLGTSAVALHRCYSPKLRYQLEFPNQHSW